MADHTVVPLKTYFAVFGALMVFTAITVAVAFVDLGAANNVVMLSPRPDGARGASPAPGPREVSEVAEAPVDDDDVPF